MSTEGDRNAHDIVSLREHIEALLKEYQKAHAKEHAMLIDSVRLAREALDVRLESMNEFRAQILSERGSMVTKEAYDSKHAALAEAISRCEKSLARLAGIGVGLTFLIVVANLVLRFVV